MQKIVLRSTNQNLYKRLKNSIEYFNQLMSKNVEVKQVGNKIVIEL